MVVRDHFLERDICRRRRSARKVHDLHQIVLAPVSLFPEEASLEVSVVARYNCVGFELAQTRQSGLFLLLLDGDSDREQSWDGDPVSCKILVNEFARGCCARRRIAIQVFHERSSAGNQWRTLRIAGTMVDSLIADESVTTQTSVRCGSRARDLRGTIGDPLERVRQRSGTQIASRKQRRQAADGKRAAFRCVSSWLHHFCKRTRDRIPPCLPGYGVKGRPPPQLPPPRRRASAAWRWDERGRYDQGPG